jgi:hypothetical protein
MSLSPNHTNDLVHEREDSTGCVFEAGGGAEVTVSTSTTLTCSLLPH